MKYLLFLVLLISLAFAEDCDEPETWGGASCTENSQCNLNVLSQNSNDNYCNLTTNVENVTTGHCVCDIKWAGADCSHERYDKNLAGGLEFLCFIGVGGVGNFVAGSTG